MAQGIFGGATSYEEQSLTDIDLDIQRWIKYTDEIKKKMKYYGNCYRITETGN